MILEEETFKKFGYYPKELKPKSGRRILAKCDECGKIRDIFRYGYCNRCHQCGLKDKKRIEKLRQVAKERFKNLEDCTMFGKHHSDETRKKISDHHADFKGEKHPMYGRHHTEETKQKMREMKQNMSEEVKKKISKMQRNKIVSEESKKKMRDNHSDMSGKNNPNYGKSLSDYQKQRLSETHKGKVISYETRQKISNSLKGENNPSWKEGISFQPYCIKFNDEFKERVREYFGRCCYVCGKNEIDNKAKLCIHHVTYNKETCCDDSIPLFAPLCRSCHTKTNFDREYWQEFFTVSLNYLTDGECYLKKDMNK